MSFDYVLDKLRHDRRSFSSVLIIIGVLLLAMVIGNLLAAVVMIALGGIGLENLADINGALMQSERGWWALMLGQGVASIFTFILAGWFYWRVVEKKPLSELNFSQNLNAKTIGLVVLLQLCFMPLNSWLQELNEGIGFPASLSGLEDFMKQMESSLAQMTEYLTNFDSFPKMLVGFIVIAVVAGVGEELIFRGLIQRKLYLGFKNPHVAIWVAAFIFSAIHMQFYGLIPRMMLGAMFGYFYYWTGNLWVPIIAHIFNNGFAVVIYYLSKQRVISADMEEMEHFPMPAVIASAVLSILVLFLFKKYSSNTDS